MTFDSIEELREIQNLIQFLDEDVQHDQEKQIKVRRQIRLFLWTVRLVQVLLPLATVWALTSIPSAANQTLVLVISFLIINIGWDSLNKAVAFFIRQGRGINTSMYYWKYSTQLRDRVLMAARSGDIGKAQQVFRTYLQIKEKELLARIELVEQDQNDEPPYNLYELLYRVSSALNSHMQDETALWKALNSTTSRPSGRI